MQTQIDNVRTEIRSHRNLINDINNDIKQADTRMAHFREQIANSTDNLNSSIRKKAELLEDITENAEKQLAQIVKERQNHLERMEQTNQNKVSEEVDRNMVKARGLTDQWNTLNRTDIALNETQESIVGFLQEHLSNIRQKKLQDDLTDNNFQQLNLQEQTLQRMIQEMNEEKWPYFMDNILESEGVIARASSIFSSLQQLLEDKDESWDIYKIRQLELKLEQYEKQLVYFSKNPEYENQLPKVNNEIRTLRAQLQSAHEQQTKDMQWIISKNYQNSIDGQARALEILSSEMARLAYTEQANRDQARANERAKVEKEGDFWNKMIYEVTDFFNVSDWFASDSQEMTNLKNLSEHISQQKTRQVDFLKEIFSEPSGANVHPSSWLSVLNQWDTVKNKMAEDRKKLENNELFQSIRPYLTAKSQERPLVNLTPSDRLRNRFHTEATRRHAPSLKSMKDRYIELVQSSIDSVKQKEKAKKQEVETVMNNEIEQWQNDKREFTLLLTETEALLAQNKSILEQQIEENQLLLINRIETIEQKGIKQKQRESVMEQLATRKRDPYDWGDLKVFYFASHLRQKLDTANLRSTRSERNTLINLSYVDSLLGAEGIEGFANTSAGKTICSSSTTAIQ